MTNKQALINEIEHLPSKVIDEIYRYVSLLKSITPVSDVTLASEEALAQDWLRPEEDDAWANL